MVDNTRIDKITRTTKANQDPAYSDFYLNFNRHPESNILLRATNEESVKKAIKNLVLTRKGERLYQPEFGGNLDVFLFENISASTSESIKTFIIDSIQTYEPRARVIEVVVIPNEAKHSYEVGIIFEVINSVNPVSLTLTLFRVR